MKKIAKNITLTIISLTMFLWQGCVILSSNCWGCDTDELVIRYGYIYMNDTDTSELFHFSCTLERYSQEELNHLDSIMLCNLSCSGEGSIDVFLKNEIDNICLLDPHDTLYNKGIYDKVLPLSIPAK